MKLRKVYLEGELGERYGREFEIAADSFADVFRCLDGNFSDFRNYLIDCDKNNIGFYCEVQGKPLVDERELLLNYPEGSMVIDTIPAGSKSGIGKILAAVAIVAIMLTPGLREFFITTSLTGVGPYGATFAYGLTTAGVVAAGIAVNLALTGLQQLMAPDPSVDSQQDESYLFQGSGQTALEGDPVPVIYGKLRVPGRPIGFAVKNANQAFRNVSTSSFNTPSSTSDQAEQLHGGNTSTQGGGQTEKYPQQESD